MANANIEQQQTQSMREVNEAIENCHAYIIAQQQNMTYAINATVQNAMDAETPEHIQEIRDVVDQAKQYINKTIEQALQYLGDIQRPGPQQQRQGWGLPGFLQFGPDAELNWLRRRQRRTF